MCEQARAESRANRPTTVPFQTLRWPLAERFPLAFPKHYDDLRPRSKPWYPYRDLIAQLPDVDPTAMRPSAVANSAVGTGYLLA